MGVWSGKEVEKQRRARPMARRQAGRDQKPRAVEPGCGENERRVSWKGTVMGGH